MRGSPHHRDRRHRTPITGSPAPGNLDSGAEWLADHKELIRDGFAWVGVSAQQSGVEALKADSVRYAPLSHPGGSYSYDIIFSQAGQAPATTLIARPGMADR